MARPSAKRPRCSASAPATSLGSGPIITVAVGAGRAAGGRQPNAQSNDCGAQSQGPITRDRISSYTPAGATPARRTWLPCAGSASGAKKARVTKCYKRLQSATALSARYSSNRTGRRAQLWAAVVRRGFPTWTSRHFAWACSPSGMPAAMTSRSASKRCSVTSMRRATARSTPRWRNWRTRASVTCRAVPQDRRPDRKVYRITGAGRRSSLTRSHTTRPQHKLRSEFLAMIYFAELMDAERLECAAR